MKPDPELKDKRIAVGLSGGVDSSVAAYLLKEAGYDVFAMFMQNWHDITGTLHGECEWEEDLNVARMVARKIGIPFRFIDLSDTYRENVVDYMFDEYAKGRTPNPDVLCNSKIKFAAFLKAAQDLGADYVATGHYCRKDVIRGKDGKEIYRILAGADDNKDQSYFLCQLSQEQLSRALFPIGDITKPEVRRIAREADLPSAEKKDSQGICFVGKVDLPVFLQQKLASRQGKVIEIFSDFYDRLEGYPGYGRPSALAEDGPASVQQVLDLCTVPVSQDDSSLSPGSALSNGSLTYDSALSLGSALYDTLALSMEPARPAVSEQEERLVELSTVYPYREEDGKFIGNHIGAQYYTIGQRKGLNIGGHKDSIFVIETDIENNTIYVGEGHHHPGLLRKALRMDAKEVHWIRPDLEMKRGESRSYLVRIRYRQPLQKAVLFDCGENYYLLFEEHQRGITPGQFAVWYSPEDLEMVGSAVIA